MCTCDDGQTVHQLSMTAKKETLSRTDLRKHEKESFTMVTNTRQSTPKNQWNVKTH